MICPSCKNTVPDGAKFCENCGAPILSENDSIKEQTEPAKPVEPEPFVYDGPAVIPESNEPEKAQNAELTAAKNDEPARAFSEEKASDDPAKQSATAVMDKQSDESSTAQETKYSEPQTAEVIKKPKQRKKMNTAGTVAICIAFGILITAFMAAATAVSSVRKTLLREAISEAAGDIELGNVVVGDLNLGLTEEGALSEDATISELVKVMLEDYEKSVAKGLLEVNNVTVDDIKNIPGIDLDAFVRRIDGVNSVNDLNMEILTNNFSKFSDDEIKIIVEKYSNEDFPEQTFEIDKEKIDSLLNDENSSVKDYLCDIIKAYEVYLITGDDTEPINEKDLKALAKESVDFVLEGKDASYIDEINMEMEEVIKENKKTLSSYNPSNSLESARNLPQMALSIVTVIIAAVLAVGLAVVIAVITKHIDAAVLTLGIAFAVSGIAALCVNLVTANLSMFTGLDYAIVNKTLSRLLSKTLAADFTVMGVRALIIGVVLIAVFVVMNVIKKAIKNKKALLEARD